LRGIRAPGRSKPTKNPQFRQRQRRIEVCNQTENREIINPSTPASAAESACDTPCAIFCSRHHHFDALIEQGAVKDYAEIARLAQMTRARVTQIMYLKYLAPEIQEQIALLPQSHGQDPITEKQLRRIEMIADWQQQQKAFAQSRIN
jgi:hypothetical protein